jgi:hypothetical protein
MLFDLRGRGRRGTVRVIYIGLALLIGLGLVGFGVGGGFGGGGILNATSGNEATGGASFASQIKKYEKLTHKQPEDVAAWESLTKALLHEAGNEGNVNSNGTPTSKGKELYRRASVAWNSYLGLNPKHTNSELAQLVYRIYSEEGLNEPARAVAALQVVVESRPTASYYSQLAIYAYKAKNESVGDLAAEKAVSLAPPSERARLRSELAEAKKYPSGGQSYTTTTNGKVFRLKKSSNGEYTGTQIGTTPQPATTTGTSTTKK